MNKHGLLKAHMRASHSGGSCFFASKLCGARLGFMSGPMQLPTSFRGLPAQPIPYLYQEPEAIILVIIRTPTP